MQEIHIRIIPGIKGYIIIGSSLDYLSSSFFSSEFDAYYFQEIILQDFENNGIKGYIKSIIFVSTDEEISKINNSSIFIVSVEKQENSFLYTCQSKNDKCIPKFEFRLPYLCFGVLFKKCSKFLERLQIELPILCLSSEIENQYKNLRISYKISGTIDLVRDEYFYYCEIEKWKMIMFLISSERNETVMKYELDRQRFFLSVQGYFITQY